jgi:hypothetical protein
LLLCKESKIFETNEMFSLWKHFFKFCEGFGGVTSTI